MTLLLTHQVQTEAQTQTPVQTPAPQTKPEPDLNDPAQARQTVDAYLLACAAVEEAEKQKEALRKLIVCSGKTTLFGSHAKLKVSIVDGRRNVDVASMVKHGLLTQDEVDNYTTQGKPYARITAKPI